MPLVFQYGSNATRARLIGPNRLNASVEVIGRAETVDNYDIAFTVFSTTNQCAAANLVPAGGRRAWGVLYEMEEALIHGPRAHGGKTLAEIEGSNYEEETIRVRQPQGTLVEAVTFLAKPTKRGTKRPTGVWYVSWIVYGLREHRVPEEYIRHVIEVALNHNWRIRTKAALTQNKLIKNL